MVSRLVRGRKSLLALMLVPGVTCFYPLAGCHSQPELTPQQAEGQHYYQTRCAHCHEENDLALKPAPPSLHHIGDQGMLPNGGTATDAAIRKVVLEGKGKMPSFAGRFNDEQLASLTAYLRTEMR